MLLYHLEKALLPWPKAGERVYFTTLPVYEIPVGKELPEERSYLSLHPPGSQNPPNTTSYHIPFPH